MGTPSFCVCTFASSLFANVLASVRSLPAIPSTSRGSLSGIMLGLRIEEIRRGSGARILMWHHLRKTGTTHQIWQLRFVAVRPDISINVHNCTPAGIGSSWETGAGASFEASASTTSVRALRSCSLRALASALLFFYSWSRLAIINWVAPKLATSYEVGGGRCADALGNNAVSPCAVDGRTDGSSPASPPNRSSYSGVLTTN